MNKLEFPEMEVVHFEDQDIIVTSGECDLCAPDCQEVGDYDDK